MSSVDKKIDVILDLLYSNAKNTINVIDKLKDMDSEEKMKYKLLKIKKK